MKTIDRQIEYTLKVMYEGAELKAALKAFKKYPTYECDCKITRAQKEGKRQSYMQRLLTLKTK